MKILFILVSTLLLANEYIEEPKLKFTDSNYICTAKQLNTASDSFMKC